MGDSDGDAITARFSNPSGISVGNDDAEDGEDIGAAQSGATSSAKAKA